MPAKAAAAPKPSTESHGKRGLTSAEPGLGTGTVFPPGRVSGVGIVEVGTGGSVVSVVSVEPVLVVAAPRLVLVVGPSVVVEVVEPDDVVVDGRLLVVTIGRVVVVCRVVLVVGRLVVVEEVGIWASAGVIESAQNPPTSRNSRAPAPHLRIEQTFDTVTAVEWECGRDRGWGPPVTR